MSQQESEEEEKHIRAPKWVNVKGLGHQSLNSNKKKKKNSGDVKGVRELRDREWLRLGLGCAHLYR